MNDSSEPVESRITRTPSGGRSASSLASATITADGAEVVVRSRHDLARPMSAITPMAPSDRNIPARFGRRAPASPHSASRSGPRKTPNMIGTLWLARACCFGISSMPFRGSAGWNTRPECAASWCATNTTVRSPSGSPASATTFQVERCGSVRLRNQSRPPLTSS